MGSAPMLAQLQLAIAVIAEQAVVTCRLQAAPLTRHRCTRRPELPTAAAACAIAVIHRWEPASAAACSAITSTNSPGVTAVRRAAMRRHIAAPWSLHKHVRT